MVRIVIFISVLCMAYPAFSSDSSLIVSNISILGNKKTRPNIILRELTFQEGDTLLSSDLEKHTSRSRENILNTSLFNFVTINILNNSDDKLDVLINVEERWYFWPALIFKYEDRNFSAWLKAKDLTKTKYGFSIEKFNFLGRKQNLRISFLFGYAKQLEISYKNIALDRNRRHFIGGMAEISRQDEMIFDTRYGELLGAHMIGANVTELIAEIVVARNLETTGHEIIKSIHPHPTMSEAIMEAAAAAYNEVIHI